MESVAPIADARGAKQVSAMLGDAGIETPSPILETVQLLKILPLSAGLSEVVAHTFVTHL